MGGLQVWCCTPAGTGWSNRPVPSALVGDIYLIPEQVQRLIGRLKRWIALRQTPPAQRRIAIVLYGFPRYGAAGTAALLNVPRSLLKFLQALKTKATLWGFARRW